MKTTITAIAILISSMIGSASASDAYEQVKNRNIQEEIAASTEIDLATSLKGAYKLQCGNHTSTALVREKFAITGSNVHDTYVLNMGVDGQTQDGHLQVIFGDTAKSMNVTINGEKCKFSRGADERVEELLQLEIEKDILSDEANEMYNSPMTLTVGNSVTMLCNNPKYQFSISNDMDGLTLRAISIKIVKKEVPMSERTTSGYYAPREVEEKKGINYRINSKLQPGLNEVVYDNLGYRLELTQDLKIGQMLVQIPEENVNCRPYLLASKLQRLNELKKNISEAHKEIEK